MKEETLPHWGDVAPKTNKQNSWVLENACPRKSLKTRLYITECTPPATLVLFCCFICFWRGTYYLRTVFFFFGVSRFSSKFRSVTLFVPAGKKKQFYYTILDAILIYLSYQFLSSRHDVSLLPLEQTPKHVYCTFHITIP